MTNTILLIITGILFLGLFFLNKLKKAPIEKSHPNILELNDQNFEENIKNKLVLVDFWAAWCMPCKVMAPILNELSNELPVDKKVGKVDIESYPKLAQKFGIKSIPTLVLFKNGKEVARFVGVKQKNFLKTQMEKF